MSNQSLPLAPSAETVVQLVRLIVGVMAVGLVAITTIFHFVFADQGVGNPQLAKILMIVVGVLAISSFAGFTIFRKATLDRWRRRMRETPEAHDEADLVQPFFQLHLVGAALSEAPGLVSAVLYLTTRSVIGLAGVALAVLVLTRFYPRDDAFRRFVGSLTGSGTTPA